MLLMLFELFKNDFFIIIIIIILIIFSFDLLLLTLYISKVRV